MRILVDIIHPAHVHFFRNAINIWRQNGHEVAVTARQKDVTIALLENYKLEHMTLSKVGSGLSGLLCELIYRDIKLWKFCRKFKPDVLTGISGVFISHVGKLIGKPSVVWDDTEHQSKAHRITWPVATQIQSPDCYLKEPIAKQHLYKGFHELAYLRPEYFTPDKEIVSAVGINVDRPYCLVRLVSWGAHHDVGQSGFDAAKMIDFLEQLAKYAKPYLSVEGQCPPELEKYQLSVPVHQIHHVMAFARLVVGEGATMISEAAVLGTPAVYINTLGLGYINMLEEYGILKQTIKTDEALEYCLDFLRDENTQAKCERIRQKILNDKIDVTKYIVEIVEQAAI